jgi:hypothetical protein
MQTLNVGAGRTDEEYKAAEQQRRADLRDESRLDANFFFLAAALAGLGTGLFPLRLGIFVNIGVVDLLALYAHVRGLVVTGVAFGWLATLVGLGFAAQKGHRWAFWFGVILYGVDMIALAAMFSVWSIGVHGFFVFKWFQGQKALHDLDETVV